MNVSEKIKSMIKNWEGCRLTAYKCPAGVWTIGYGHTGGVSRGYTISQEHADKMFDKDIEIFARGVESLVCGVSLNQNQFDALVSFAYNVGVGTLKNSTLLKKVRLNPNDETIRNEFKRYVFANGKVLQGLVKRRDVESNHYFSEL